MSETGLVRLEHPLPPARGLVLLVNGRGRRFAERDIRRWIRLNRIHLGAEQVDLSCVGNVPGWLPGLLDWASDPQQDVGIRLSLRTDCSASPPPLGALRDRGLCGVALYPDALAHPLTAAWLAACAEVGLPVRLNVDLSELTDVDVAMAPAAWAALGVRLVSCAPVRPFAGGAVEVGALAARLAPALEAAGIDFSAWGLPFCAVPEAAWPHLRHGAQAPWDHHGYLPASLVLVRQYYTNAPRIVSRAILRELGRTMSYESPIDHGLLRWLMNDGNRWYWYALLLRKVTRYLPGRRERLREVPTDPAVWEAAVAEHQAAEEARLGPECGACRMRRVCDRTAPGLPGFEPKRIAGPVVSDPMQFTLQRPRYVDEADAARVGVPALTETLAAHARQLADNVPATHTFDRYHYEAENTFCMQHPGAVRWFSLTAEEKRSTELGVFRAPCTIAVMVGGGIAAHAGFALGRNARVVCPMELFSHRLLLHVDAQGRYVLLRDGAVMRPSAPGGACYTPAVLPTVLRPKLSLWDIDGSIFTQNLQVWEEPAEAAPPEPADLSIVITSVRFTRRLQATLLSIAHQEGVDLRRIEVIVAYVPGLDATDDLLTAMAATWQDLRIVRSPFPERYAKAKGYVLNESIALATGKRVLLLDSDILMRQDMLARVLETPESAPFVGPDRRKMLTPETTAKVLLGEKTPWADWEELVDGPGEMRVKEAHLPVGFFQCVRRDCLKEVRYPEYDHFEGADWDFIVSLNQRFGDGVCLEDTPVLHLDHGGSQWYGTHRHL